MQEPCQSLLLLEKCGILYTLHVLAPYTVPHHVSVRDYNQSMDVKGYKIVRFPVEND